MILQPLCTSPDLGAAIAFAKSRYASLSGGARPATHNIPYAGASGDTFLCRITLFTAEESDVVRIILVRSERAIVMQGGVCVGGSFGFQPHQQILILVDKWDVPADFVGGSIPFYGPGAAGPHTVRAKHLGVTGSVLAFGGPSGAPLTLASSSPSVCSVTSAPVSFAELLTMSAGWLGTVISSSPNFVYDAPGGVRYIITPEMPVTLFTLTLAAWGNTSFTLSQASAGGYDAAPTLNGGDFIFPEYSAGVDPADPFVMSGGFCVGGAMGSKAHGVLTLSGGCAVGGSFGFRAVLADFTMGGGCCIGGAMSSKAHSTLTLAGGFAVGGGFGFRQTGSLAMSGGFAIGGAHGSRAAAGVSLTGGFAAGGSFGFRASPRLTLSGGACIGGSHGFRKAGSSVMSGGAAVGGSHGFKAAMSFAMTGGAAVGGEMGCIASASFAMSGGVCVGGDVTGDGAVGLVPPTALSFPVTIGYDSRLSWTITLQGTAKRGGVLSYAIESIYNIHAYAAMNGVATCKFEVVPETGWYGTAQFGYSCTETTADGVAVSAWPNGIVTVQIAAPLALVAAPKAGLLKWTGGAGPFSVTLHSPYQANPAGGAIPFTNKTVAEWTAKQVTVPTTGWCTSGGYLKITDAFGKFATALLSACGVPTCSTTPPPPPNSLRFTYQLGNIYRFTGGTRPYAAAAINTIGAGWVVSDYVDYVQIAMNFNGCYNAGGGLRITDAAGGSIFSAFKVGSGPVACASLSGWQTIYTSGCTIATRLFWIYDGELNEGTLTRMSADGKKRVTWGFEDTGSKGGYGGTAGEHSAQVVLDYWGFASFASCDSIYYFWPGLSAELDDWYPGGWDMSVVHIISMEQYN